MKLFAAAIFTALLATTPHSTLARSNSISPDGSCRLSVVFPNDTSPDVDTLNILKSKGYNLTNFDFDDSGILSLALGKSCSGSICAYRGELIEVITMGFPPSIIARTKVKSTLAEAVSTLPNCQ